MKFAANKA